MFVVQLGAPIQNEMSRTLNGGRLTDSPGLTCVHVQGRAPVGVTSSGRPLRTGGDKLFRQQEHPWSKLTGVFAGYNRYKRLRPIGL